MNYIDRNGTVYEQDTEQDKFLRKVYGSKIGRSLLRPFVSPVFSCIAGKFLDSHASRFLITSFINKNHMDMKPYIKREYHSFNDFFTREIKPEERMIDYDEHHLVSPSDGKVSAYFLNQDCSFEIKNTRYTIDSLLKDKKLAKRYQNGHVIIVRLTVDDYHRYCYPADARKSANIRIPGILHTVNPAACETVPVYKENTREFTLLKTKKFGTILQMEVGALMVGRICNYEGESFVKKGEEKGKFEFGGSTILLLTEHGKALPRPDLLHNTANQLETMIKMGESIGHSQ